MTGRTASSSNALLAEVFRSFLSCKQMPGGRYTVPGIISLSPLSLATDVTDATLGASGLWLGTRTGAGGTATLTEFFFLAAAHGPMDNRPTALLYLVFSTFFPVF